MKIRDLIEHLKTLEQDSVFCFESYDEKCGGCDICDGYGDTVYRPLTLSDIQKLHPNDVEPKHGSQHVYYIPREEV